MSTTVVHHERQEFPLSQKSLTDLETLRRNNATTASLSALCAQATKFLTEIVQDANDRAGEVTEEYKRLHRIREKKGVADTGEKVKIEAYQKRVDGLSKEIDQNVRRIVDVKVWSDSVAGSLQHVSTKSREAQTRHAAMEQQAEQEEDNEGQSQRRPPQQLDQSESSTSLLHAALSTAEAAHTSKTFTERYSQDATYRQFYELYWESKHSTTSPKPVLPHHSTWFAAEEGRRVGQQSRRVGNTQRSTQGHDDDVDEDDEDEQLDHSHMPGSFPQSDGPEAEDADEEVEMQAESRSIFCPLSMRKFVDPVVSTKCPHTFEREAIQSFIDGQTTRLPLTEAQEAELTAKYGQPQNGRAGASRNGAAMTMKSRQPKCAKCPVCLTLLTQNDLRDDLLMRRQIKRAEEEERRQAENGEDDDSEDELVPGTQRRKKVLALGSSPVAKNRRSTQIKDERLRSVSIIPNSQSQGLGETMPRDGVNDVDDVDDTMEDE